MTATFCERCGTRQEFRAPRSLGPIRKTRGFIGGLKNYIGGSDALSEAMREGMQAQESVIAAAQLDAFHESIHLCIDCRQYTCNDCWNVEAGRCRTCAPLVGVDDLADRIAASLDGSEAAIGALGAPSAVPVFDHPTATPLPADSWPQADHEVYPATAASAGAAPTDDHPGYGLAVVPSDEVDADEAIEVVEGPMAAEAEPEPVAVEWEPEPVAAEAETPTADAVAPPPPLRVVAWDEDAPPVEAPEPAAEAPVEPERLPEPIAATAAEAEAPAEADVIPVVPFHAFDDMPSAAEFEPTPIAEPVAQGVEETAPEPEPTAPEPPFPAIPARPLPQRSAPMRDRVIRTPSEAPPAIAPPARPTRPAAPQERVAAEAEGPEVAARRAQLEMLGLGDTDATAPVVPDAQVLPYRSRGASVSNRDATSAAIREGALLWEASAREVDGVGVTVHSCDGCGLALSATARFCRRCGTRQAQSA